MKKIVLGLLIILGVVCLTGCDSSVSVDNLLSALQKENIVDNNLKLIDTVVEVEDLLPIRTTYYIYEENSDIIAINYNTDIYAENDYDYSIVIYYNVEYNEEMSTYEINKYDSDNQKKYIVYKDESLFFKTKYIIEEAK